jgi:hypothetical protein
MNLLDDEVNTVATTLTNDSGKYIFVGVPRGNYTLVEEHPAGYEDFDRTANEDDPDRNDGTVPNDEIPVTLAGGEQGDDNDLIEFLPGFISGKVIKDDNVNGDRLNGVAIRLVEDVDDTVVATTDTDGQGEYVFRTSNLESTRSWRRIQPA